MKDYTFSYLDREGKNQTETVRANSRKEAEQILTESKNDFESSPWKRFDGETEAVERIEEDILNDISIKSQEIEVLEKELEEYRANLPDEG